MGYYSEVAMVICGAREAIVPFMMQCQLNHPDLNPLWEEVTVGKTQGGELIYIGVYFDSVKWYSDFDDVKRYKKLWDLAGEHNGLRGDLCRVGEDVTDTEVDVFDNMEDYSPQLVGIVHKVTVDVDLNKRADIRGVPGGI